jgi:NAD(P)-dependent dehydrogenase (short-subunit alcohol dehydrogenase family)
LKGRTAVVTGAGRGIGRDIALALAGEGCRVVAVARTEKEIAGVHFASPFLEVTEEEFDANMNVNLKATFFLCQSAIKVMIEQRRGYIINISSTAGIIVPSRAAGGPRPMDAAGGHHRMRDLSLEAERPRRG